MRPYCIRLSRQRARLTQPNVGRYVLLWLLLFVCSMGLTMCQTVSPPGETNPDGSADASPVDTPVDGPGLEGTVGDTAGKEPDPPLQAVCARDVPGDFAKLPQEGSLLVFGEGDAFKGDAEYQYAFHVNNQFGNQNHFQGVVRWGRHLYLSGGDLKLVEAQLFVVALGSRPRTGPLGSNVSGPDAPHPATDSVLEKLNVTKENHWHAGGIGRVGPILAVPLENNQSEGGKRGSTLLFMDLSNPTKPKALPISIRSEQVAYALGITRLALDGKYLIARWNDKELLFYTSKSSDIAAGFDEAKSALWKVDQLRVKAGLKEVGDKGMHGQSVSLVTQCDGQIFALMNDNPNRLPTKQGVHYLDLYSIKFPEKDTHKVPSIEKIGSRSFACPDQLCNFTAGGGTHVDQSGRLLFYSVPLFRDFAKKRITVVEFAPKP